LLRMAIVVAALMPVLAIGLALWFGLSGAIS
jgi:hypothetical protein